MPYLDNRLLLHLAPPGATRSRRWVRWATLPASAALGYIASMVVPPFELPWSIIAPVAANAVWASMSVRRKPGEQAPKRESPHQRWSRAWWCERDRGVFVPGETALLAPEGFSRWVRSDAPGAAREERERAA